MKNMRKIWMLLPLVTLFSCTEDVVIDLEEGKPLIGIEASFTDELKHHEAILSYTANFYNSSEITMISGARLYVTDGIDTIRYYEDSLSPGHYFSELAAGKRNTNYRMVVDVPDDAQDDGWQHLFAESYMQNNVEVVDSLILKPFLSPVNHVDTLAFMLYPYFQSLSDPSIVYMLGMWKNDTLLTDTLTKRMSIPMAGYAGYYVNGPEMLEKNMEIPVGRFRKNDVHDGDYFRVDFYSIPSDYMYYLYNLMTSMGNNPMMGPPSNVVTNVQPQGKGVGWFYAASVVSAETVWHKQ